MLGCSETSLQLVWVSYLVNSFHLFGHFCKQERNYKKSKVPSFGYKQRWHNWSWKKSEIHIIQAFSSHAESSNLSKVKLGICYKYTMIGLKCPNSYINPNWRGGGAIIIPHRRIAFSPQPNIAWTRDKSVNSSFGLLVE